MDSAAQIIENIDKYEKWKQVVFNEFDAIMNNKIRPFPCIFGVNGYQKDMLRFGFYKKLTAENIMEDLINYCDNYKSFGKNTSFVAFEEPTSIQSIEVYREKFWSILKDLRMLDDQEWPKHIPKNMDDPLWEFCFHGEPMFIVCNTPSHINRISRKSSTFMLTFQPRWVFSDLLDTEKKAKNAFSTVGKRLEPFDIVAKSPFLGKYGDPQNREWAQYFLQDNNTESPLCPYHIMERNND